MYPITMIHRNMSEGVFMNEINQFFFTFLNSLGLKYKKSSLCVYEASQKC